MMSEKSKDRELFEQALAKVPRGKALRKEKGGSDGPAGKGSERRTVRLNKLVRRADFEPEASVDLHALTRSEARKSLSGFLEGAARRGLTVILVVHGRGSGVLKAAVAELLAQSAQVVEQVEAPRRLGGQGACIVRLRSSEKRGTPEP